MEKYLNLLETIPLFHGIARDDIPVILKRLKATTSDFEKGEYIRSEGDAADFIGIVLEGEIHVLQDDYYGNRNLNFSFQAGDMFAEAFACAGTDFLPVNVTAVEDSKIMFIDCRRISNTCSNACGFHQQVIFNLLHALAAKNVMLRQKMEITSKRTTREKLLAYLALQAKLHHSNTFTIPYDRQELANYLQVDRSAMSAEIGRLRKEGLIQCSRSRFTII